MIGIHHALRITSLYVFAVCSLVAFWHFNKPALDGIVMHKCKLFALRGLVFCISVILLHYVTQCTIAQLFKLITDFILHITLSQMMNKRVKVRPVISSGTSASRTTKVINVDLED
jgi:hypothetical protein